MGSSPPQGNIGPLGTEIESGEIVDNAVTDAKIATQVSTKITGLPTQTQDLNMGEKDVTNLEGLITVATSPTFAGSLTDATNMNAPNSIFIVGDYAYVVSETSNSLAIIDISVPSTPVLTGSLIDNTNMNGAKAVYVSGGHAYVASSVFDGLAIIDVTTPATPVLLGSVASSTNMNGASSVFISGMHAYVTGETSDSLAIIDITDPTTPTISGSLLDSTNMNGAIAVHISGMYAHVVSNLSNSITTVDISDSTTPTLFGTLVNANLAGATDVYVSGNIVYITGSTNSALVTIDITDVSTPSLLGSLVDTTNMGGASGVFVSGDHAYVTGLTTDSLAIIDISAPSAPLLTDSLLDSTNLNGASSIYINGNDAYITSKLSDSLAVIDINGIDTHVAKIGSADITHLAVTDNAVIANNLYSGGLNVGSSGIHSAGDVSVTGDAIITGDFTVDTDTLVVDSTNDRVGVRTASPSSPLHVVGDSTNQGDIIAEFRNSENSSRLSIVDETTTGSIPGGFKSVTGFGLGFFAASGQKIIFYTGGVAAANEKMRLDSGNLGIGLSSSISAKVHILETTEQLRLAYDASNYVPFTVDSTGDLTIAPTGSNLNITGAISVTTEYQQGGSTILIGDSVNSNIFVGLGTGASTVTGEGNTAIGNAALAVLTAGIENTAIGSSALAANTIGDNNIAIGSFTLTANISGADNIAFGVESLKLNTTGSNNIAIGLFALEDNTTGTDNIGIGISALENNILGRRNIAIGENSGFNVISATLTGENVFLGYNTGLGIITGVQNTILGANVSGLSSTLSNNIILADGAGVTRLQFNSSGDATIGGAFEIGGDLTIKGTTTSIITEKLDVADNHIYMNSEYETTVAQTVGLVVNYLPTSTIVSIVSGVWTAGVASTSNPTVTTIGSSVLSAGDLIQIRGTTNAENNGIFEVLSETGNVLTIRGVGVIATVEDFTDNQFVSNSASSAVITKVTISVIRSGTDGVWESAAGSTTGFSFDNIVGLTATQTITNKSIDWTDNTMSFTSAEIAAACSDETGANSLVFQTAPTLIAPTFTGTTIGPSGTWNTSGMDLADGDTYEINGVEVLSATTLGSTVVSSSLTSLGTLSSLTISGDLSVDTITPTTTLTVEGNLSVDDAVMTPFGGLGQYQNLILQSEDFTDSNWDSVFGLTVTGDSTIAPNGETTADTLDWTTGTNTLGLRQTISSGITNGNTYTISFWAQFVSGNTNVLDIDIGDGDTLSFTIDSSSLKRYSGTTTAGSSFVDIANNGSNTGIFKMWGFQIVDGSDPLPYTKTTDSQVTLTFGNTISGNAAIIGNATISGDLTITSTTEQLRLAYDVNNYTSFTVDFTGFGLLIANYDSKSFGISEDTLPTGSLFNSDGTTMIILGNVNKTIYQYSLSTAEDISTASYDSVSFSISTESSAPIDFKWNSDGTKIYILDLTGTVFQYSLSTAYTISTMSYDSVSFSVASQDTAPEGIAFNSDGSKMFIAGNTNDTVYEYDLSTNFVISSAVYNSISFGISEDSAVSGMSFNSDGTRMLILGFTNKNVFQYTLTTGYDLSSASYDSISFNVGSEDSSPGNIVFNSDGSKMYMVGDTNDTIYQYSSNTGDLIISPVGGNVKFVSTHADTLSISTITTTGTNAGTSSTFVGSQDPDGNVIAAGGDIYIRDNGALSRPFFNKEATTGTDWEGISLIPSQVHQLFSTAEYEDLGTASVITTSGTRSLNFKASVVSAFRHTVSTQASELQFIDQTEGNQMIYTGTSTFITAAAGGDITSRNAALIAAVSGTQLFDYVGEGKLAGVDIIEIVQSSNLAQWDLGSIGRVSTGIAGPIVRFKDTNIITTQDSLTLDTCVITEVISCLFDDTAEAGSGGPLFSIKNTGYKEGRAVFLTNGGRLYSGESLVRIDAGVPENYRVEVIDSTFIINSGGSIFDTSGSTGTFTAVADASISATTITGVTDSSGVASFTHAGTTPPLGSLVTISGFTTNTSYNTTGIVTASTSTTFEVDYIAFGTSETGSYLVNQVTITSTAHGLTLNTGVTLDTDLSTDYDGGFQIYSILTNSFNVPGTFTSTLTGTWSTKGLDQTDPRVRAFNNPDTADSKTIAEGVTNTNTTATTITDGTYAAIDVSTHSVITNELLKLIDATAGIWEYQGNETFNGKLTGNLSGIKTGSTGSYRIVMSTNGVVPTFATANYVPMEVKTTTIGTPLEFSVILDKGDTIQIMMAGDGTSDNITVTDLKTGIQ